MTCRALLPVLLVLAGPATAAAQEDEGGNGWEEEQWADPWAAEEEGGLQWSGFVEGGAGWRWADDTS